MMSGVIGAKVVGVVALLLLARLFTEEAFGLLGILQALVPMVLVVASLSYQVAIGLPDRDEDAASLVSLAVALLFATSLAAAIAVYFLRDAIAALVDAPLLAEYLWFGPPLLFFLGLYDVLVYWATRTKAFRRLAWSRVLMAAGVGVAQVAAWGLGYSMGGLILGLVLGTTVATALLTVQTFIPDRGTLRQGLDVRRVLVVALEYRQFPTFQAPASLVSSISMALVPLGLGYFFGPAVVGLYWMADRVCAYLSNFVRQSMQHVFLHRAAEVSNRGGDLRPLFRRTTLSLLGLALGPTLLLVFWGPTIFELVLGTRWLEAGSFARWLAVAWLFSLLSIPAVQLAAVFHLQQWTLIYSVGLGGFSVAAVVAGGFAADPLRVFLIYAVGHAVCSMLLVLAIRWRLSNPGPAANAQDRAYS